MECTAQKLRTAPVKAGTKLSPRDDRRDLREWTKLTPAVGVVRGRESAAHNGGVAPPRGVVPCSENTPKIRLKNCETNGSFLCLQRFDKFWIWSGSNDRKRKLCDISGTCKEKLVKSFWVNLISADFSLLKPLCGAACCGRRRRCRAYTERLD